MEIVARRCSRTVYSNDATALLLIASNHVLQGHTSCRRSAPWLQARASDNVDWVIKTREYLFWLYNYSGNIPGTTFRNVQSLKIYLHPFTVGDPTPEYKRTIPIAAMQTNGRWHRGVRSQKSAWCCIAEWEWDTKSSLIQRCRGRKGSHSPHGLPNFPAPDDIPYQGGKGRKAQCHQK